ncbi:SprT family zinc-dependent metalloprotease [Shewanella sp. HL-SH5]|uniref:SprT family zinc-dependent metalloprotease n=1 Tax=Shewanella sp. HL-SH5 TaxID=3436241 RepID=UPI003EBB210B
MSQRLYQHLHTMAQKLGLSVNSLTAKPKVSLAYSNQQAFTHTHIVHPKNISEIQQSVIDKIEIDYQLAEHYFKQTFPRPLVQFTLRGKSAGTAHLQLNKLRFNPILLDENTAIFIDDVVPHEISHLLSFQLFGRVKPHGAEWQTIMRKVFNRVPKTTHQLDTQSVRGKQFEYFCGCGSVQLSVRRHNNVLKGKTQYRCKSCQHTLRNTPLSQS